MYGIAPEMIHIPCIWNGSIRPPVKFAWAWRPQNTIENG